MATGKRLMLCGGLASGKSSVTRMLSSSGIRTIDSDSVGHAVLEPDGEAFDPVAEQWPEVVTDGVIDRKRLGPIVFGDSSQLRILEGITHPFIIGRIQREVETIETPVVVEFPVLKTDLGDGWVRAVVDATRQAKLGRAIARGMSEADARARLAAQPSRAEWLAAADIAIPNLGSFEELEETVRRLISWVST